MEYTTEMMVFECYKCGVPYGMTTTFVEHKKKNKEAFYCPNGHPAVIFSPSDDDKVDIKALKTELLQRTHDVEQLEAKLAEKEAQLSEIKEKECKGV